MKINRKAVHAILLIAFGIAVGVYANEFSNTLKEMRKASPVAGVKND